jgi:hypothetical protein
VDASRRTVRVTKFVRQKLTRILRRRIAGKFPF